MAAAAAEGQAAVQAAVLHAVTAGEATLLQERQGSRASTIAGKY
jgi:hypothetical protein